MLKTVLKQNKTLKQKTGSQNPKTNGKSKAIQQSHTKKHTTTHPQKEKNGKKYIYILKRKRTSKSINKCTNDNKL